MRYAQWAVFIADLFKTYKQPKKSLQMSQFIHITFLVIHQALQLLQFQNNLSYKILAFSRYKTLELLQSINH